MGQNVQDVFENHEGFEAGTEGYEVKTTTFEGTVVVSEDSEKASYTVTVRVPSLDAATADDVSKVVALDWFETLERRLEDAPKATRTSVTLDTFDVENVGEEVRVTYEFSTGIPETAADVAKTFVEYVEGTYAEGIIPGYEYEPPVSDLIASASQSGDQGTPL